MLQLDVALLSERGGRQYNEDACGHWHSDTQLCCVLADGAGGHGGGDVASELAVQELVGLFSRHPTIDADRLAQLLRQTNDAILRERLPGRVQQDMHSTVVGLVIDFDQHRAHWAHAGDSRMYWFRGGRVIELTRDHSLVQALVDAGMLADSEICHHPKRSELRSALGLSADMLEVSAANGRDAVQAGDVFMLCTDGLWEYLDDSSIERMLAESTTPKSWLDTLSAEVYRIAGVKVSHDNFSVLTVWASAA